MKKKFLAIILCLLVATLVCAFAACSENTKRDPVKTDLAGAKVSDNGGMAVKYGNYVYFVNGFAGETALNSFGSPVRGAICRTTLKDGVPDYTQTEIIVGKNVFGEDKTYGGIYIVNDYIYYNTTSVDKNSAREYKSTEGVLTRTYIDGSKTETVKELDDNDIALYAGDNSKYLVYSYDSYLYGVNSENNEVTLLTKPTSAKSTEDKQTAVAYKFVGDYAVYTMYNYANENNYSSDYIVYAYNLKTGKLSEILNSKSFDSTGEVLYSITIVDIKAKNDGFELFYSKKGNDNGKNDGFYSYSFADSDMTFSAAKEVRYTHETTVNAYSSFTKLSDGTVLAFNKKLFDVFNADGSKKLNGTAPVRLNFEKDVTLVTVEESETEVYAYYLLDSKFYYIKLFTKTNGVISEASSDAVCFFSGKYDTTYLSYDFIGNTIYYFNDDMGDNAYFYTIPSFETITAKTEIGKGKLLGILTEKDRLSLIAEAESEE